VIGRAAALPLLALALAGCAEVPPAPRAGPDPFADAAMAVDSLEACGRLDHALDLARRTTRMAVAWREPAWRVAGARAHEGSLAREAALPPAVRAALERATTTLRAAEGSFAMESLAAAREQGEAAWRSRLAALGPHDLRTAEAALARARIELALSHVREADSLACAARDGFIAELGPDHPRIADAEEILGLLVKNYSGVRGLDPAVPHYVAALRLRNAAYGPSSLPVAETMQDLGNLFRVRRDFDGAAQMFHAALEIRRAQFGPVNAEVASTLGSLAYLSAGLGRWSEAEALAREAIEATPSGPGTPTGDRAVRTGLRGRMLLELGRVSEAIPVLRETAAWRESVWARTPRDEASTIMAGLSTHRDLALALALEGHDEEAFEELARGMSRTLAGRLYDPDARVPDPWRGLLPQVQRQLREDEALVTWVRSTTRPLTDEGPIMACVVRSSGPVRWIRIRHRVPATPHLGTIRDVYWNELHVTSTWPRRATDTTAVGRMARLMEREWFAPLEPALTGARRLVVCSPDLFAGGPLGALVDEQGRWLADRFRVSYMPSALLFVHDRENARPAGGARGRPALLVGDPSYSASDPGAWPRLAGAGDEIRAIASGLPNATVLTGPDASAARLRELAASGALARFGLVHFAAHSVIDIRGALESSIVLAPDRPGSGVDSRVFGREVAGGWRLDADLVSLAACRSMQGMVSASEGSLGLHEAFLSAGARSLLVTLWPVDDRATAMLMEDFYRRLGDRAHPADRAEALSAAQADLRAWRAPDGTRPFAHPAYWAAFALIGDPG
jgi:tetratricopeptide (TPR) repeat protein